MASDILVLGKTYKLRAGSPMPIGTVGEGDFVMHTFMAEESDIENYLYTNTLPKSDEMRGQGGVYISANFNRLDGEGGNNFSGRKIKSPTYIEER